MLNRSSFISLLKTHVFNIPGWRTGRKLIVFESDDWGNVRVPSLEVYQNLLKRGIRIDLSPYRYDGLENAEDISFLAETLRKQKNSRGDYPLFTINNILTNPDFERIEQDGFRNYHYEYFVDTYARLQGGENMKNWRQGMEAGVFYPQLHGREHLNVRRWMNSLQRGYQETRWLFDQRMYALDLELSREKRYCYNKALDPDQVSDRELNINIINEACRIFEEIWGYRSETFVAPNYTWDALVEKALSDNQIKILQGMRVQFEGDLHGGDIIRRHYMGQRNQHGQVYLTRNCYFEPSLEPAKDWVASCLREIESAFLWRKPAIICSHRANYAGVVSKENRDKGLEQLSRLLSGILRKWPDVHFLSSNQLGNLILEGD